MTATSGKKTLKLLVQEAKDFEEDVERVAKRGLRHTKDIINGKVDDMLEVEKYNSLKKGVKA